jgi:hypothetical protein
MNLNPLVLSEGIEVETGAAVESEFKIEYG